MTRCPKRGLRRRRKNSGLEAGPGIILRLGCDGRQRGFYSHIRLSVALAPGIGVGPRSRVLCSCRSKEGAGSNPGSAAGSDRQHRNSLRSGCLHRCGRLCSALGFDLRRHPYRRGSKYADDVSPAASKFVNYGDTESPLTATSRSTAPDPLRTLRLPVRVSECQSKSSAFPADAIYPAPADGVMRMTMTAPAWIESQQFPREC